MSTQDSQKLIDRLFSAGAHFGFKKSRRHPTMVPYLFTSKDGNDIIDLEQSAALLQSAVTVVTEAAKNGKNILFVGTKEEVVRIVKDAAEKAEMPYVVNRWIGGMLTNFSEIKKRIARLEHLLHEQANGELERKYTKKERVLINREIDKLKHNFGGIATLTRPADMMVVVDPRHDSIAVQEALDLKIPVIAIMSSDCNASSITHPVVVNDALQSSVSLVLNELASGITTGKAAYVPKPVAIRDTRTVRPQTRRPRRTAA
jgi:small subunit ribosomal protein S2